MLDEPLIQRLRAETAGCEDLVFFNNAGASLQPRTVVERVIDHLRLEEQVGGYEAADRVDPELAHVYDSVARLLHCSPGEIALLENSTRAWDMAFYSMRFAPGDRIVTAANEYASNYIALLQVAQRTGAQICVVDSDPSGEVDLEALRRLLDERVKLIALTHLPTNGGLVQPAASVGQLARQAGIPFLLDATQAVGQVPLDVDLLGCDMLSATGRKYLRGPRGTGFLYVRKSMLDQLEPPMLDLHAATWTSRNQFAIRTDARKFETWESAAAIRLGLGVAIEYALALGLEWIERRVQGLAALLRERLAQLPGVTVHDLGRVRSGIVTFRSNGHSAGDVMQWLRSHGIAVRVVEGSATLIDMEQRNLDELVRASVHYYNTQEELERLCHVLQALRG
ncbi:MAG: aminotransferase class V-fold PLP-dependent enzyme [Acidobacteriaceae bacterium]